MQKTFKALEIRETEPKVFKRTIVSKEIDALPEGEVLIKVSYSSLNYKDALSSIGNKGVTRNYPHTPGIDAAGYVEQSSCDKFKANDPVIVTGYDLGMNTAGGFGEYIRVPAKWVVPCPEGLSLKESMVYGTAGFTAAISVYKLINAGVRPESGEILVTGATGGVGSIAVSILGKLGYTVIAATGKVDKKDMLVGIGASDIIDRKEIDDISGKPMLRSRWAGVIDTVGGNILASAIKTTHYGGAVTCCGNIADHTFSTSVYPFILRGVSLHGVDSVECDMPLRLKLWENLSSAWKSESLMNTICEVGLDQICERIDLMLKGAQAGRTVLNHEL